MKIKISGGAAENGVVFGNAYDKYGSTNQIVNRIMKGFNTALSSLVVKSAPQSIHEVGCGEGYWVIQWTEMGIPTRGCDLSAQVIDIARENGRERGFPDTLFEVRSIYDLQSERDNADLVVCCEVLEHLEDPNAGLMALQRIAPKYLIISVPREPLWRALNLARGKYIRNFGNTPGHIQHWSRSGIELLVSNYFDVLEVKSPLPWTMLLCRARS